MSETVSMQAFPVLDPTARTTEQIHRELMALRELMEARLNGIDRATIIFQDNLTRVPTDVDKQVGQLRSLHNEKFTAVEHARVTMFEGLQLQFKERDIRSAASEDAAKVAVNAALQAQKEAAAAQNASNTAAIAKSEVATTKQIDSILALLASNNSALTDKLNGVSQRLDRGEGVSSGAHSNTTQMLAVVAVAASMLGVGIALFSALSRGTPSPGISAATPQGYTLTTPAK